MRGAYIVAVNHSFRIPADFSQNPDNYPSLLEIYDNMGTAGILSVMSVINSNVDYDDVTILPASFESPYIIRVTATDDKDEKINNAGYGVGSIDIGAPGYDIDFFASLPDIIFRDSILSILKQLYYLLIQQMVL